MNTHGRLTVNGTNWFFLVSLFCQLFIGIVLTIFYTAIHKEIDFNVMMLAVQIFAVLAPAFVYMAYKEVNIGETLRLKPMSPIAWLLIPFIAIAGQFVAQMINLPVLLLLDAIGQLPESPIPTPKSLNDLFISFGVIALAPAICEEIVARGVLMKTYERRGSYAGIIISALFFGIMHMDIQNLFGPIVFGLLFGYIVYRTGSILAGMLAHFTNNAFAMLLSYVDEKYHEQFPFLQSGYFLIIGFIISVILLFAIYWLTRNLFQWNVKPKISSFRNDLRAAFLNPPMYITLSLYVLFTIFIVLQVIYPEQWSVPK